MQLNYLGNKNLLPFATSPLARAYFVVMFTKLFHQNLTKLRQIIRPSKRLYWKDRTKQGNFNSNNCLERNLKTDGELELVGKSLDEVVKQLKTIFQNLEITTYKLENSVAKQTTKFMATKDNNEQVKNEFLANISHELLTPLNAILGFSQLMLQDSSLAAKHQQNLGIIHSNAEHLLTLINDLLEIAKIESGKLDFQENCFDLYCLLISLENQFKLRSISPHVKLEFDYSSDLPQYISTDRQKLRQVLVNLLDNGIKYTESGRVVLRVSRVDNLEKSSPSDSKIKIICFEVEDTGFGIAPSEIDGIFEAFVQGEKTPIYREGNGLGLAISQQFVRLLGGEIVVDSIVQQGSLFKFQIPAIIVDRKDIILPFDRVLELDRQKYLGKKHKSQNVFCKNRLRENRLIAFHSCLDRISPQWIERVHQAAIQVDTDLLFQLIEQIEAIDLPLSQELKTMVNNFEYDEIIELTGRVSY
jgi:signal transduction histidine kinase